MQHLRLLGGLRPAPYKNEYLAQLRVCIDGDRGTGRRSAVERFFAAHEHKEALARQVLAGTVCWAMWATAPTVLLFSEHCACLNPDLLTDSAFKSAGALIHAGGFFDQAKNQTVNVRSPAKYPQLVQDNWESPPGVAGAAYLENAIKLRDMSARAPSPDTQQAFMRLAVLYEELAEYAAATCVATSHSRPAYDDRREDLRGSD